MEEENNRPRHELGGRTPNQVLEEEWPSDSRKPVNNRLLVDLFWEKDERVIRRGGCIELDGRVYQPADAYAIALDMRQGQRVLVRRDPYALDEAVAIDPETFELIGELHLKDFVAQTENGHLSRDQIKAAARRNSKLKRFYGGYYFAFHAALAAQQDWQTEWNARLARAKKNGTDGAEFPAAAAPGAADPVKISAPAQQPALARFCPSDEPDIDLSNLELED
jgi:hypothetical protein